MMLTQNEGQLQLSNLGDKQMMSTSFPTQIALEAIVTKLTRDYTGAVLPIILLLCGTAATEILVMLFGTIVT